MTWQPLLLQGFAASHGPHHCADDWVAIAKTATKATINILTFIGYSLLFVLLSRSSASLSSINRFNTMFPGSDTSADDFIDFGYQNGETTSCLVDRKSRFARQKVVVSDPSDRLNPKSITGFLTFLPLTCPPTRTISGSRDISVENQTPLEKQRLFSVNGKITQF